MARNPNYLEMENKMSDEEKISFAKYLESIKPFTVGDLRKVIADLPDDMQILMAETPKNSYSDWFNVSYEIPNKEKSNYSALTFFPVDNYDSRQF